MNNVDFNRMVKILDTQIDKCEKEIKPIDSKETLENMTIKDAQRAVNIARNILGNMDSILQTELYHVIGMGNLTAIQLTTFTKKIKIYCSYRSYVKAIASYNIPVVPNIPEKADYRCKVLQLDLSKELGN